MARGGMEECISQLYIYLFNLKLSLVSIAQLQKATQLVKKKKGLRSWLGYFMWTKIEEMATIALPGMSNPALD